MQFILTGVRHGHNCKDSNINPEKVVSRSKERISRLFRKKRSLLLQRFFTQGVGSYRPLKEIMIK